MKKIPFDIFSGADAKSVTQFIEKEANGICFVDESTISELIRPRNPAAHKNIFGHSLIIGGSEGKCGAAILASTAALRTGCGLVTALIPAAAVIPLLSTLPEAMSIVRNDDEEEITIDISRFQSVGFGPGIGMQAASMLSYLLRNQQKPLVIDADGLTLLSRNTDWYQLLAPNIILTPHPGEFDRLTKKHDSAFERFKTQLLFSKSHQVYVLLKGQHTTITSPNAKVYCNTTGNSGMATAGSGDVLTGIITSLLAQGYSPEIAAVLGAYLHGFAGDKAAEEKSMTSMIASDIIDGIPAFFKQYEK